ncbi:VOC family protein [Sphingomonas sp. ac-8]|uniref:VOC family protein n=1 Tax=Sphingomonas sp. ac-8 TaxID=3242977 RepID=UPI003A803BE8
MSAAPGIAACLWYDGRAADAARFYAATFPDSRITAVRRSPVDYPAGKADDVLTVEFTIRGMAFVALNGGPGHPHSDAASFQIFTEDQAETDRIWAALIADGGAEVACSWCRDRWGVSWQIVPRQLTDALADPDPAAAARAMQAMMGMVKIDIAAIEAARNGG